MRDLLLALVIFGSLPVILYRPWVGVIMWNWIAFMQPHRLAWGYMYDLPVAMIVGVTALIAWALSKQEKKINWDSITVLIAVYMMWTTITTIFAIDSHDAWYLYKQFFKIILMVFVALSLIKTEKQLRVFIWTAAVSIGYFSIKGGLFTVLHGGNFRVWGPPGTFIEDNNALALATVMVIPLMIYLAQTTSKKWVKLGLYSGALLSLASVIGSYSRGGFLGLAAIVLFLWLRSKRKVFFGLLTAVGVTMAVSVIPSQWFNRMNTIEDYQNDESAEGRLNVWQHAIRIANDRPVLGGGFGVFWDLPTFRRLSPGIAPRAAHSIYFEVLGYHGYIGLVIFLTLGASAFMMCFRIERLCRKRPGFEKEYRFAKLVEISLIGYAVSGAFLNLAHWDLYFTILAFITLKYNLVRQKIRNETEDAVSDQSGSLATVGWALPAGVPGRSFLRPVPR